MDHTHALESHAAERYLLGELAEGDREAFELHYFECPHCAEALESGSVFIDNARAVFTEPKEFVATQEKQPSGGWWQDLAHWWARPVFVFPTAAAIALGSIALYQTLVVVPRIRQALETPRVLPAFQLIGPARGEGPAIEVSAGSPAFALAFDIPPGFAFAKYEAALARVESPHQPVFQVIAPPPSPGQPITILLPTVQLKPGQYTLDVAGLNTGGGRSLVATYQFDFKFNP